MMYALDTNIIVDDMNSSLLMQRISDLTWSSAVWMGKI